MRKEFITIKGKHKGPTSTIIVGVHGNEKCGVEVINKLLPSLKIDKGKLFIGYGSPLAIQKNKRYIEENLNRMFRPKKYLTKREKNSYEYNRALLIKKYLDKSDALFDVHASQNPKSKPFIICEKNAHAITQYLPVKLIVSGFDKNQPGGTDYYMNKNGKIGICLECGYLKNQKSKKIARDNIINFLAAQGHIHKKIHKQNQIFIKIYKQYISKTNNFTLIKNFKDFENLSKNEIIGFDGKTEIKASQDSIILFAKESNKSGEEVFLLGKYKKA